MRIGVRCTADADARHAQDTEFEAPGPELVHAVLAAGHLQDVEQNLTVEVQARGTKQQRERERVTVKHVDGKLEQAHPT